MRLDVVVPVHNEIAALPSLVEHLRELAASPGVSVLAVDGESSDDSVAALRAAEIPYASAPRGRASQMNAGAQLTDGDAVVFLHADSKLPPSAHEEISEAVRGGAVAGFFQVRLDSSSALLRLVGRMITVRSRLTGIATGDQAMFVTRATFEKLGGFAPLPLFEDVELCGRLRREGKVARLQGTVVTSARRWERLGPVRTILRMWMLRAAYAIGLSPQRLVRFYEASR